MKVCFFATFFVFLLFDKNGIPVCVILDLGSRWVKISFEHWICCCQYSADGDDH